jgi:hypothetical protein
MQIRGVLWHRVDRPVVEERTRSVSDDDHEQPLETGDRTDVLLSDLLAGPSPVNMVHGAIELGDRVVPRPSDASIAAARNDVLAALWGPSW